MRKTSFRWAVTKERQKQRLAVEKPMLRAFWCWLDELAQQPLAGGLKKAVQYAQKQRPYMENYLLDGRCELSNNLAENAIRPGRKGQCGNLQPD